MEKHREIDYKITWKVESTEKVEIIIVVFSLILLKKGYNVFRSLLPAVFMMTAGKKREKNRKCLHK